MSNKYKRSKLARSNLNLRVPVTPDGCFKAAGGLALLGLFLLMLDQ